MERPGSPVVALERERFLEVDLGQIAPQLTLAVGRGIVTSQAFLYDRRPAALAIE